MKSLVSIWLSLLGHTFLAFFSKSHQQQISLVKHAMQVKACRTFCIMYNCLVPVLLGLGYSPFQFEGGLL